jgi:small subunit ribosomal protein S4
MGDPKRIRRKFDKTKAMWSKERIESEHALKEKYGLKNLRELWTAGTEVSRIRRNVRKVLSGASTEKEGKEITERLIRYNLVKHGATLDDLLGVTQEAILERRLQSIVFKKGLGRTAKQSRQLISHGFISINGRQVKSPGYMVTASEEPHINYYKPIDLDFNKDDKAVPAPKAAETVKTAPETRENKEGA